MIDFLKACPKVEHHVHIEGATPPGIYLKLAKENGVSLPFDSVIDGYKYFKYKNLINFLEVYSTCTTAIQKPDDFETLIDAFAYSRMVENIRYCEFYISLSLHILHELNPEEILSVIGIACRRAEIKYNIKLRCIPDISRDRDIGIALDALKAIIRGKSEYIIGIGLGGSERTDTKRFAGIFQTAIDAGLKPVVHAGEWRGTQVIWDSINYLGALRIGHGITAVKDHQLMEFLATTQIPVEVCPSSNIRVGLVGMHDHPVSEMVRSGLNVTIHSDDPAMFDTSLWNELAYLVNYRGFTEIDIISILRSNINASFMTMAEKKKHFDELNGFLANRVLEGKINE